MKRLLAAVVMLVSVAMLLASLVGGVGVWKIKEPATAKANQVFHRVNHALGLAEDGLKRLQTSLARAAERLETVKAEQRRLALQPQPDSAARRLLARTIEQTVAPDLGNANETLHNVAEAAVVVNSVLQDFEDVPLLTGTRLDTARLAEANQRLAEVGPAAWQLSRWLSQSDPNTEEESAHLSRIEEALVFIRARLAEYEPRLADVQQRITAIETAFHTWVTPAAYLVSFVCFWIALSQISLLAHAWSWWKRR